MKAFAKSLPSRFGWWGLYSLKSDVAPRARFGVVPRKDVKFGNIRRTKHDFCIHAWGELVGIDGARC
jgi:hypothetical protein